MLLITQAGGVGVLSSNTVHGVVYLRSCPAVHLERRGYPLKRVSLDSAAETVKQEKKKPMWFNKESRMVAESDLREMVNSKEKKPLYSTA